MFGGGLNVPVPDVDRTDHLLMLGANPYASNGSLATAPDWPGRLERLRGAGRHARGGRPAPVADRRDGRRVGARAAGHRRLPPDGHGAGALRRGPGRPRRRRGPRRPASTRSPRRARRSRPRSSPRPTGIDADTIRRLARELAAAPTRRASTAASAPPPPSSARSPAGWSTCSTRSPATSTGPAGRCSRKAAAGAANTRGKPRYGREVKLHRRRQPGAGPARDDGRAAGGGPGRGDRHAGRGPGPGADHGGRQPGAVHAERRAARRRARRRSSSWCRSTST